MKDWQAPAVDQETVDLILFIIACIIGMCAAMSVAAATEPHSIDQQLPDFQAIDAKNLRLQQEVDSLMAKLEAAIPDISLMSTPQKLPLHHDMVYVLQTDIAGTAFAKGDLLVLHDYPPVEAAEVEFRGYYTANREAEGLVVVLPISDGSVEVAGLKTSDVRMPTALLRVFESRMKKP